VAHVGIQRLGARHRQHHGPQHHEGEPRVFDQKHHPVQRIERRQHGRIAGHAKGAQRAQRQEPQQRQRPEQRPDAGGAVALDEEQRRQHADGDRHHVVRQTRRQHADALNRRQHGNGRRDDGVAVEQRGAEHAQDRQHTGQARPVGGQPLHQRQQRQDAALAVVVGAHDEGHVLGRHHQRQRPEQQRQHAEQVGRVQRRPVRAAEAFLERIQRTGADIAEHHAERPERQQRQWALPLCVGGRCGGVRRGHADSRCGGRRRE
jgi:hypothetical protein